MIDARRLPEHNLEATVCIVGSGMGGASVAKKLIEAGLDVLILEAGGDAQGHGVSPIQHQVVGRSFGLPLTRALEIGGSTNLWHGICAPFDPIDFEAREWIPDSGWPISHRELAPHYTEAQKWLGVAANPPEAPEPGATVQDTLVTKPFWTCRTPARMKDVVLDWTRTGKARCLMHAVALEFRADAGGTVRSLVVGCGDRTMEVKADVFIVAAGGLETPRLLLNSGRGSRGFEASAALTGRFLMDHPTGYFSQVVYHASQSSIFGSPTLMGPGRLIGFAIRPELQRRFKLPNHYLFLRPGVGPEKVPNSLLRSFLGARGAADLSLRHIRALLTSRYIRQRVVRERFGIRSSTRYGDIYVMAEQIPNRDSKVGLSDEVRDKFGYPIAQVDWRTARHEWDHFGTYFGLVADALRTDQRIARLRLDPAEEWPQVLSSAAHHLGTARMASSPAHGVVDPNLRVFGSNNLFVCDGSVFPTAGGTNPSMTISALALRLGGHLARVLASPDVVSLRSHRASGPRTVA